MNASGFKAEKTDLTIYWYIQYIVKSVFYVYAAVGILCGVLIVGAAGYSHASVIQNELCLVSLEYAAVDDDLEVRDENGRIVQDTTRIKNLEALFFAGLFELLYIADIHSIQESRIKLQKRVPFGKRMLALPFEYIQHIAVVCLCTSTKKLWVSFSKCGKVVVPLITILIFPFFFFILRRQKLSTVNLRE